jgi:hypothetical protein
MTKSYQGSCLCGIVRFEFIGTFDSFFLCHCQYCQKDTGSAHASNLFAKGADVNWISGKEWVESFTLPSTRHAKSFCRCCGSALPHKEMDGQLLVIPAGSLDCDVDIAPNAHIFCASRAKWDNELEEIKKIDHLPE